MLTVDIIEQFVSSLVLSGQVTFSGYNASADRTELKLSAPYHLRTGMTFFVNSIPRKVVAVEGDSFFVQGDITGSADIYIIPAPFYFHGTPIQTNNEIVDIPHPDKFPMCYLYEVVRERELGENSNIEREAELRFFFLDTANFEDWTTDDHYTKRLLGLNRLVDKFKADSLLPGNRFYLYETVFTRINHTKWGTFTDNKGYVRNIFSDELTGVELTFTLPIRRSCN